MSSQFEKRKAKSSSDLVKEVETRIEELKQAPASPVYTQTGLDIFSNDGGKTHGVAEISYNPVTKEATVIAIYQISRLVALTALNQKTALNTLKRKLIVKD